ncbi:GNAT family N-acetyltransferase [Parabacteroides acidifaciens]|uniref:GNAT family N-acetyltransferase n=1 Tax=Parabacteroides acidifaciens TaxID=2290935 RepID=A0A3D8HBG0_9BACT|nr:MULTISPECIES: GNAT family N-acetyltransferase [Parabacteroides]MBC8603270.1 GNAT family N-acetyltransferase [Parabacteroides acidifaciens]RDU47982.1 GNAT family N-acetyltransferase [Parabacteroides acidifaciens]RHR56996.1 GNAT family N-acetyltransferase [Parabacteroides sp. AF17-28]
MQDVIKPIDHALLKAELTKEKKLRRTNKSNNEIYIVTAHDSPNVMQEIGRLREIAFRYYGGGTGCPVDIDEYDTMEDAYRQLIVWSPEDEQILGGYRFLCGSDVKFDETGKPILATSHLFNFSEKFNKEYLPYTVELGRSFVTLEYQSTRSGSAKGLFVLDNLWDGLGALSVVDPSLQYYFGKVTMYNTYNSEARNMILYFLNMHFPDPEKLITPVYPLETGTDLEKMQELFKYDNFRDNYKVLNQEVRKFGINVPPLVNAYMSLSPKMRVFGTAINHEFGEVEETGILIAIDEILEEKKKRHIETYLNEEGQSADLIRKTDI